jgi:hypothetical protein
MTATIINRARRRLGDKPDPKADAKDYLDCHARELPSFVIGPERQYNGIVVHADDSDAESFLDALSASGFAYEAEVDDQDVLGRLEEACLLSS